MTPVIITEHGELIGTARIHLKPLGWTSLYLSQRVNDWHYVTEFIHIFSLTFTTR